MKKINLIWTIFAMVSLIGYSVIFISSCNKKENAITSKSKPDTLKCKDCDKYAQQRNKDTIVVTYRKFIGRYLTTVNIIEFDSCEWVGKLYNGTNCYILTHRGQCKYCQKRLEQTIEKIVYKYKAFK